MSPVEDGGVDKDGDEGQEEQTRQHTDSDEDEKLPASVVTAAVIAAAVGLVHVAALVSRLHGQHSD